MHLNRFRLGVLLVAACVIVAVLTVAFAGSGGDANLVSGSSVAGAAGATAKVPGASVSLRGSVSVEGVPQPIHVSMAGVQDVRGHSAHMAGYYTDFPRAVPGQLPGGRIPIATVSVQPRVYFKSPLFAKAIPNGKEWLGEDIAKVGKQIGVGDPTQLGQNDPMQFLKYLRATSAGVTRVGSEDVRGVATTHYRGTVELRRLADSQPAAQRDATRKSIERLITLTGTSSYPVEAWVDSHHLVRRIRMKMKMKIPQTNRAMTMDLTLEMYDFGPKHKATAPPADSTYDITAQAAKAAKAGAGTP